MRRRIERARERPAIALARVSGWLLLWLARLATGIGVASIIARALPYRATVDGVPVRVEATLLTRTGLSADTTFGSWSFPHFTGLPIGVHISPVDIDLLTLTRQASPDADAYVSKLKADSAAQLPYAAAWLAGEILLGFVVGLVLFAAVEMAVRYARGLERPRHELRRRARQVSAGVAVIAVIAAYGAVSYNPRWAKQSRLSGTLATFQLFPGQLENYYAHQSKAADALSSIIGIQATLQDQIAARTAPNTSFNIMFISDVHLAAVYPLVAEYAENFDAKLIINTGDESEFGSAAEMTSSFTSAIASLTKSIPMLWLAGNHDSPEVESIMAGIPGVTVLGNKARTDDGPIAVKASAVDAYGLAVAGLPDPRVYGASGADGSDDSSVTDKLEKAAVKAAVAHVPSKTFYDIFATHEPVAATELTDDLSGQIRQTNSGHVHAQNATSDVQKGSSINLVEGSTGAGGLDNIAKTSTRPPIEFSIESVSPACQFTRVLRFQLNSASTPTSPASTFGNDVTVSTLYLKAQKIDGARYCGTSLGISKPVDLPTH